MPDYSEDITLALVLASSSAENSSYFFITHTCNIYIDIDIHSNFLFAIKMDTPFSFITYR